MERFIFRLSTPAKLWGIACALALSGCGGSKDPILGASNGTSLAPAVSATAPSARSPVLSGVAINTQVTATFNKPMDPASLNGNTFTLACPAALPVIGTVRYDASSHVAILSPASRLPVSTRCVATITKGAKDSSGVPLATDFVWAFDTSSAIDSGSPSVSGYTPALDAIAPLNTQVIVTFSEDMAPETINASSVTLRTTLSQVPITGTVSYSTGARTATFTPLNPSLLPGSTSFTATVSTLATDLAGNPLIADYVWSFSTANAMDSEAPRVTLLNPGDASIGICLNKTVNATFNEPMDPLTLTTSTLTLTPSVSLNSPVPAVVSYDANTRIASIHPIANLSALTAYTATVRSGVTGVKDLANNAMAADKEWQFTTGASECQTPLALGSSSSFAILASAAITNIPTSKITGNVGLTPDTGANITGLSVPAICSEVLGHVYAVDASGPACALMDAVLLSNAKTDAMAAYTDATSASRGTAVSLTTNLAGLTLYPGLYESLTSIDLSAGGILTLDAQGDPNAVFLIRSATSITSLSNSQVVLSGGANAAHVFWTAGSAITLGTYSIMKGTMLAGTALTLQTGASLEGRALNQGAAAAAITCDACKITLPSP